MVYVFIIYRKDGFVEQITMTNNPDLPVLPEELNITSIHIPFPWYNPELIETYYLNGKFYEDKEFTKEIIDPSTYMK